MKGKIKAAIKALEGIHGEMTPRRFSRRQRTRSARFIACLSGMEGKRSRHWGLSAPVSSSENTNSSRP
jgi:hypothetical protein